MDVDTPPLAIAERAGLAPPASAIEHARHDALDLARFLAEHRGGITVEEGLALSRHAACATEGDVVEIGTFRGKSAVALCHGLHQQPDPARRLHCVDPHADYTGFYGGVFGAADRAAFYHVMLKTGYHDRTALVNLRSEAAARAWEGPIGLLFIDGDHSHAGVRRDVAGWEPHVRVGACIAFDDSVDPAAGPQAVIGELLRSRRFELVERVGKVTFLRKLAHLPAAPAAAVATRLRVLVVCHELIRSGGLLRFERVARHLRAAGHELCFATLAPNPRASWASENEVLTLEEAARRQWTTTMVPGAGFPDETIATLARLRDARFGYRVQHVLNGPSLRQRFLEVNRSFAPDLVVFNNRHWTPGSYTDFQARRFAMLEGAVDAIRFAPSPYRNRPSSQAPIVIGGLANKHPGPLLEALRRLPTHFHAALYGQFSGDTSSVRDLLDNGRLRLLGPLDEAALPGFYADVDIVVHTEGYAGWSNLVAEAMASGVPVVCTPHGTKAFAHDGETARVVETATGPALATAIADIVDRPEATMSMVRRARETIVRFDWQGYARQLEALCVDDRQFHYTDAPELGLHGKWPLADRLKDLETVFAACRGATVLDLGCAEGVIARRCLERGAKLVHGLDLELGRVHAASRLCAAWPESHLFIEANLDDWQAIRDAARRVLLARYDIVLYLGIQHHLATPGRLATLDDAIAMAGRLFAVRTTPEVYREDAIERRLQAAGFTELRLDKAAQRAGFGEARLFQRCAA